MEKLKTSKIDCATSTQFKVTKKGMTALSEKISINFKEPHCEFILVWSQLIKIHIEKSRGLRGGQNFPNYFYNSKTISKMLFF